MTNDARQKSPLDKVRVSVLGTGSLGKEHVRIYAELAQAGQLSDQFQLVGVDHNARSIEQWRKNLADAMAEFVGRGGEFEVDAIDQKAWQWLSNRMSYLQGDINDRKAWGRDHHPYAFTIWMAGAGIKPGLVYGESDDFAFNVAKDPVDIYDFQATVLHLLGIDHERLTFKFQGRQFRLTDVHGNVVKALLS